MAEQENPYRARSTLLAPAADSRTRFSFMWRALLVIEPAQFACIPLALIAYSPMTGLTGAVVVGGVALIAWFVYARMRRLLKEFREVERLKIKGTGVVSRLE